MTLCLRLWDALAQFDLCKAFLLWSLLFLRSSRGKFYDTAGCKLQDDGDDDDDDGRGKRFEGGSGR